MRDESIIEEFTSPPGIVIIKINPRQHVTVPIPVPTWSLAISLRIAPHGIY